MAQGTIYLKEADRAGNIRWEVVICADCAAEHKACMGPLSRGESRLERPYAGPERECVFCADKADAAAELKGPRYCPMCEESTKARECKACGMPTEKVPA